MKTYSVELKKISYVTFQVEAENREAAEDAAWLELQTGDFDEDSADWSVSDIYQQEQAA